MMREEFTIKMVNDTMQFEEKFLKNEIVLTPYHFISICKYFNISHEEFFSNNCNIRMDRNYFPVLTLRNKEFLIDNPESIVSNIDLISAKIRISEYIDFKKLYFNKNLSQYDKDKIYYTIVSLVYLIAEIEVEDIDITDIDFFMELQGNIRESIGELLKTTIENMFKNEKEFKDNTFFNDHR
ncbi:hypothetical protein [Brassicibacter mesophilus]|uniref:hypothetical protein n=1 Tax=Brassicibacter mesophilus TaxID=745119 RepID=UPI003D1B7C95